MFYAVVGHPPDVPGAINAMAAALLEELTLEEISVALKRCRRECRFPVRLPDIFLRCPGHEVPKPEAEMRAAWDVLTAFVKKYVGCDPEGNYGPEHGFWGKMRIGGKSYENRFPALSQRILDVVRRTGGWRQYKCMTEEDHPFQQKRFFEEYAAWRATENVMPMMLPAAAAKQLVEAKAMEPVKNSTAVNSSAPRKVLRTNVGMESTPRKDPATEKARLAAYLKQHPEIGAKA